MLSRYCRQSTHCFAMRYFSNCDSEIMDCQTGGEDGAHNGHIGLSVTEEGVMAVPDGKRGALRDKRHGPRAADQQRSLESEGVRHGLSQIAACNPLLGARQTGDDRLRAAQVSPNSNDEYQI